MIKRIYSSLLALVMVVGLLPTTAWAEVTAENQFQFPIGFFNNRRRRIIVLMDTCWEKSYLSVIADFHRRKFQRIHQSVETRLFACAAERFQALYD